ncbi:hypothetical protein CHELA1G11_12121 [Hyphomicrobiales bacterium]|nr:hypothetical protein CHELA1G11_12121 [Hyphomicrobiales bacterium]CAH1663156.1 hypothetical protein CHELA1G2_12192 [Hyphomicrobiales bacterium]
MEQALRDAAQAEPVMLHHKPADIRGEGEPGGEGKQKVPVACLPNAEENADTIFGCSL